MPEVISSGYLVHIELCFTIHWTGYGQWFGF